MKQLIAWFQSRPALSFGLVVLGLSYFTYMHNYAYPAAFFWDENYHVASAQKYLNGVFFMEPHPPLGKLFIALGEAIIDANPADNQFIGSDYAKDPPAGFSFAGYRFFPTLFAWLTAPLLYGIFLVITRRPLASALLSFLYVFENAMIVHARSAMLDSTLLFFVAACILLFLLLLNEKDIRKFSLYSLLFGAAIGCVAVTKVNGLVILLLGPALLVYLWPSIRSILTFLAWSASLFLITYTGIWYIHFARGTHIVPTLPNQGYYQSSSNLKTIVNDGSMASPFTFPLALRDSWNFLSHYSRGVPRLDLCKEGENGSPFFYWPFGARSVNYRWETPDGFSYRYLYLQVNPVIWWSSFLVMVAALALLILPRFFQLKNPPKNLFLLCVFSALYIGYMIAIIRIDRVMYLYHYFLPAFFSFIVTGIMVFELEKIGPWKMTEDRRNKLLLWFAALIFMSFSFYRPLSYYEPITDAAFKKRAFFPLWELTCVKCEKESMIAIPTKK